MRLVLLLCLLLAPIAARAQGVTVFAAASLTDAMKDIAVAWTKAGHKPLRLSFGASSSLARQIEQGAPAHVFASADLKWMDYLADKGLIAADTRRNLLGNTLVLIVPADRPRTIAITPGLDLPALLGANGRIATGDPAHVPVGLYAREALTTLGLWNAAMPHLARTEDVRAALLGANGRIATGDPAHVPVGLYAREALTKLSLWDAVMPRLARTEDVRAALLLVERGEAPAGIVYSTDAAASKGVSVAGTFPADSHQAISYPFAVTKAGDTPEARSVMTYLAGPLARAIFIQRGFKVH